MEGSETDGALLQRLARGDTAALGPLYERHKGVVMTVLRQQLRGSTGDLEDLCHEVFLTLRDVAPRFREGSSVRGFLVGVTRPPTVPANGARLRITLSAAHETAHVDALSDALAALS